MGVYQEWSDIIEMQSNTAPQQRMAFWQGYYGLEKDVYAKLLADKTERLTGTVKELAEKYGLEVPIMAGFLDGINESIDPALDMEALEEDTAIDTAIVHEKLYYNMRTAKADWLYNLPEWDGILTQEKRKEIVDQWRQDHIVHVEKTPGRNDPCPCGSGKKYKKCCGAGK